MQNVYSLSHKLKVLYKFRPLFKKYALDIHNFSTLKNMLSNMECRFKEYSAQSLSVQLNVTLILERCINVSNHNLVSHVKGRT
jgi:hypothetical protein